MRPVPTIVLAGLLALGAVPVSVTGATASTSYRVASHVRGYVRKDGTYVHPHERRDSGSFPRETTHRSLERGSYSHSHEATHRDADGVLRDEHGRIARSESVRDAFMREHPCPCTGRTSGPCPGYVVDHIRALKHGGADTPSNMQWQTVDAAKAKDRVE